MRIKTLAPCEKLIKFFFGCFFFNQFSKDLSGLATRRRSQGKKGVPVHNVPPSRKFVNALDLFFLKKNGWKT